ncbi:protein terminal ear1-like isoform X2 [Arachis duranensis]|uniref:Protein terminal ear1-like isoform X2 n=1 Tax=Arachis duranensis TaxID=130453 RepID=A0A6P4CWB6_ARADU|nr:protein terminal ear1-like isoform X2 [Arachis duranensis]
MGNLDPTAQEFRPRNYTHGAPPPTLLRPPAPPHPQPWYPYLGHQVGVRCPTSSPTRSLMLGLVPSATVVSEAWLMKELGAFGDVRGVRMEGVGEGMVIAMVDFYDLRHAEAAFTAILGHHMNMHDYAMAGGVLWAQYMVPSCDDGDNQGTLLIFNLDLHMDAIAVTSIFQPFGAVKEVRHTPLKKNQRFVEFFDIRDAARALKHMNGNHIHGKPLIIEFGRPGGGQYRKSSVVTKEGCYDDKDNPSEELVGNSGGEEERNNRCNDESIVGDTKQPSRRHRKGKHAKKQHHHDETRRFLISAHDGDSRTTVMIKNIPNKYSQKLLLSMLDNHCNHCNEKIREGGRDHQPFSSYDFLYLPIDFKNKCNVGYGFVNMTSPEATMRLYKAFHGQRWQVFNSRKICEVTYARVQGLEALKEHFKKSKLGYEMENCLPVMFSPPRDGRQLTEPLAIVAHAHHQSLIVSSSTQSDGVEGQSSS